MKLAELGLKTKPATKYFDGGYVKFHSAEKELWYDVVWVTKQKQFTFHSGKVRDREQFDTLMSFKTARDSMELIV